MTFLHYSHYSFILQGGGTPLPISMEGGMARLAPWIRHLSYCDRVGPFDANYNQISLYSNCSTQYIFNVQQIDFDYKRLQKFQLYNNN